MTAVVLGGPPHGLRPTPSSGAQAERRLRMLRAALAENGALSVAEAATLTGASTATAARDLSALADTVGAQRVRGGVVTDESRRAERDEAAFLEAGEVDLRRLAVDHAERATRSLQAGDLPAAQVHARLAQAMAVLAAAEGRAGQLAAAEGRAG